MTEYPLLSHTLISLVIVLASFVLGKLFKVLLNTVGRKLVSKTETTLDDRIIDVFCGKITLLTVLAGIGIGVQEIRKGITGKDLTITQLLDYAHIALFLVTAFVVTRLIICLIEETFGWYMEELSKKTSSNVSATVAPLTNKIINIALFLVALIIVLDHFGINIGSLLVSLGVASLAVALAAQDTVANMIAGFVIMVDRPFRIGDRLQLPTGEMGDVYEIGLRSTRILNFDNNLIIIPNADLVKTRIINFSYPHDAVRVMVEVGVAYGTDPEKARHVILGLAKNHPEVLRDPIPEVFVSNLSDSAVMLQLVARVDDFRKKFRTETSLREQIYQAFRRESIEIPFPQRVVHLKEPKSGSQAPQTK